MIISSNKLERINDEKGTFYDKSFFDKNSKHSKNCFMTSNVGKNSGHHNNSNSSLKVKLNKFRNQNNFLLKTNKELLRQRSKYPIFYPKQDKHKQKQNAQIIKQANIQKAKEQIQKRRDQKQNNKVRIKKEVRKTMRLKSIVKINQLKQELKNTKSGKRFKSQQSQLKNSKVLFYQKSFKDQIDYVLDKALIGIYDNWLQISPVVAAKIKSGKQYKIQTIQKLIKDIKQRKKQIQQNQRLHRSHLQNKNQKKKLGQIQCKIKNFRFSETLQSIGCSQYWKAKTGFNTTATISPNKNLSKDFQQKNKEIKKAHTEQDLNLVKQIKINVINLGQTLMNLKRKVKFQKQNIFLQQFLNNYNKRQQNFKNEKQKQKFILLLSNQLFNFAQILQQRSKIIEVMSNTYKNSINNYNQILKIPLQKLKNYGIQFNQTLSTMNLNQAINFLNGRLNIINIESQNCFDLSLKKIDSNKIISHQFNQKNQHKLKKMQSINNNLDNINQQIELPDLDKLCKTNTGFFGRNSSKLSVYQKSYISRASSIAQNFRESQRNSHFQKQNDQVRKTSRSVDNSIYQSSLRKNPIFKTALLNVLKDQFKLVEELSEYQDRKNDSEKKSTCFLDILGGNDHHYNFSKIDGNQIREYSRNMTKNNNFQNQNTTIIKNNNILKKTNFSKKGVKIKMSKFQPQQQCQSGYSFHKQKSQGKLKTIRGVHNNFNQSTQGNFGYKEKSKKSLKLISTSNSRQKKDKITSSRVSIQSILSNESNDQKNNKTQKNLKRPKEMRRIKRESDYFEQLDIDQKRRIQKTILSMLLNDQTQDTIFKIKSGQNSLKKKQQLIEQLKKIISKGYFDKGPLKKFKIRFQELMKKQNLKKRFTMKDCHSGQFTDDQIRRIKLSRKKDPNVRMSQDCSDHQIYKKLYQFRQQASQTYHKVFYQQKLMKLNGNIRRFSGLDADLSIKLLGKKNNCCLDDLCQQCCQNQYNFGNKKRKQKVQRENSFIKFMLLFHKQYQKNLKQKDLD